MSRCRCGAPVLNVTDHRGAPLVLDARGEALYLPLAFKFEGRVSGFSARGDRIAGRAPAEGEAANGVVHQKHACGSRP